MSDKSADLIPVNNGTTQSFYIQHYSSFTKPLGTAILTVVSFMSTNIKLSTDLRSYCHCQPRSLVQTDTVLRLQIFGPAFPSVWSKIPMIPIIPTIPMIPRSEVNLAAHLDTARQLPLPGYPRYQYSQLLTLHHSVPLFAFCGTDCSSEIT
jgi:hypothetical protein